MKRSRRFLRDVRIAWLGLNTAHERIGLSAQLLSKAKEVLDLAQERYNLGLSSIVELSQAQVNVTIAELAASLDGTQTDTLIEVPAVARPSILNFKRRNAGGL